jgi:hypothetical protein
MRAKGARTEHRYFDLIRSHERFRQAILGIHALSW